MNVFFSVVLGYKYILRVTPSRTFSRAGGIASMAYAPAARHRGDAGAETGPAAEKETQAHD